jgi:GrpB-like predicted nucleotidyltransferase (UPF0157 family)
MSQRTIAVVPFDPSWARLFDEERQALDAIVAPDARIHHIGSTSVTGLAAKPVIDILIELRAVEALDALDDQFRSLGYEPRGENGIPGRRYFVKGSPDRTHQIHAFRAGSPDVVRHLALRDHLRAHDDERDAYALVKLQAAAQCGNDIHRYVALKDSFVKQLEARALAALAP